MLGSSLQVPFHKLNEFASVTSGKPTGQHEALTYVINHWLNNDLRASWEKLALAVEECGDALGANTIRQNMGITLTAGISIRMTKPQLLVLVYA